MASQGLYGNTPKTWNSVDEFLNDFKGDAESEKVGLRSLDVSSPACKSDIQVSDLIRETQNLRPGNIEFTVFPPEIPRIGIFPDHNTLVWEARHY